MTVPVPPLPPPAVDDPRAVVPAALAERLAAGLAALAAHYAAAAALAEGELREALLALAAAKREEREALTGPGVEPAGAMRDVRDPGAPRWGVLLGKAFEDERALERTARQLLRLDAGPALAQPAAWLAGRVAGDQGTVRRLYLRYS